ncbi:amidase [Pseudomonas fluorescens]|uniref:Glutamyl-tRNA(Gln) amidotransferase subunit A n=1 Tax=Pseudomonas fluorescens TaxID=294 RepID=A0A5E7B2C9_PSEFL|nr:amidase [Pseudomonas fluorescens]VVN82974.1 Glutamyl-tRNA(Gln) amidotransferase subunit A [Pseudomonas fluorescens]
MSIVVEDLALGGSGRSVMVKDTIDIAGYPTRASSYALADAPAAVEHAQVVQALLDAGCQITGKTSLHELAFGTTGLNAWVGTAPNPRYPGHIPGGSSSGSAAAVAAQLCDFALGTDTGGSVRIPATCCGVFGLKPTFGRVSRQGVMPTRSTLDCVGPLAMDMDRLIEAMHAIDPTFKTMPVPENLSIGVVAVQAHAEIHAAVNQALGRSGFNLVEQSLPGMSAAYDAAMVVINAETWAACGHLLETGRVGRDVAERLQAASLTSADSLADAERIRQAFTAEVNAALARTPILALPTMPDYPLLVADAVDTRAALGMTSLVRAFNLSGHPALSIPLEGASGLPVGLQLIAAHGADELLCAVARELVRRLEE